MSGKGGLSRRGFLGATTAVGLVGGRSAEAKSDAGASEIVPPGGQPTRLRVNGRSHTLVLEPRTTLADALRDQLGLTGTKVVCDRGACSACTVFLDGTPVVACLTLALDAVGKEITSIEGVAAPDGSLHVVQEAFVEHDAMQCGYCTPGMVMSCVHLVERNPDPSLEDVQTATSGNLCRCGTYPKVFAATLDAAARRSKG